LAYLNSSRSNRKFLPVIYDKQRFDPKVAIWDVALDEVISDHIHHLFVRGVEEGDRIDYKESGCLSSGADIGVTPPFVKNCTLSREPELTAAPELL